MNQVTRHRGPDGEGVHVDHAVSLGHRRLAIIDLSAAGSQPMCNEDGTIWLVCNGEIYNFRELRQHLEEKGHVFKSATDSEVIIHSYEEYGIDCVQQFNGMWAFCIYDVKRQALVLSRDRFGIKPLYYHVDGDRFIFCSMIAGILCHNIKTSPNDKAIMEYLAFNLEDHNEHTFFQNVNSLPGGTILEYDLISHKYELRHWYKVKPQGTKNAADIRTKFIESIKMHTVADVPIGSCLSGGVDSSAIVSVLSTILNGNFNTYSLTVPGARFDETRYIEEVGRKTGTKQFFTTVNEDAFLDEVHDFVAAQEEPVTGLSPYAQYRVMKLANQQGAKVLLDGQGGDELFAGYDYYFAYYYYELLAKLRFPSLLKEMALYLHNSRSVYPLAMFGFLLLPGRAKWPLWRVFAKKWLNHRMLADTAGTRGDPRWRAMNLEAGLRLTLLSTAIPHLLRWEDKNSMRWSVESRVPFLDVNLVEAAYSLSSDQKLRNGRTKVMFREAMDGIIPPMIMQRKDKIGFAAPGDELFRQPKVVAFARGILESQSFRSRPYWRWPSVQKVFEEHVRGSTNAGDTIWKWVNTELWLRQFFENSGKRDDSGVIGKKLLATNDIRNLLTKDETIWDLFTSKEEYLSSNIDEHGRFTFASSSQENSTDPRAWRYLVKNGLRPEYLNGKKFAVCLTHDVDDIYPPFTHTLISTLCCIKNFDVKELRNQWTWKLGNKRNSPYRNFNEIMELEDKYNAKSSFYFMTTKKDIRRFRYNIEDLESELRFIDDHGWGIGLHTGYYSFDNLEEIVREKERAEKVIGKPIIGCRNHYLRFKTPDTWELLASAGFKYDTTFGYTDMIGFRNGMCGPFKPFNLNRDREVDILEIPLNIMDVTLFEYMHLNMDEAWNITKKMIDTTEEMQGVLTVNWHNSIFSWPYRRKWAAFYEQLLQYAYEKDAWLTSADELYRWYCKEE